MRLETAGQVLDCFGSVFLSAVWVVRFLGLRQDGAGADDHRMQLA